MKKIILFIFLVQLAINFSGLSQKPKRYNSSDIQLRLQKLSVLGNVLYVAAHPDDENTRLITYMANEVKVNTAYFSFTRGDGGQNLIGPEIREELGLIRTQELLEARRIDNGRQFFSRAIDFGYSKHPDETFQIWDKEKVLGDLVWVIRKFKPDVIITRFNTIPGTTHGHHTASAILAGEAFDLAGDPGKYPEQLIYVDPWQPTSLYWNAYFWRRSEYQKDTSDLIAYDIGEYNPLLGKSYSEIAAESRSSHRSQGFGATGTRGEQMDYLQHEKGYKAEKTIFENIDIGWGRIEGGKEIERQIVAINNSFEANKPYEIIDELLLVRKQILALEDDFWREKKAIEIEELIYAVTGLFLEARADDYTACVGETVEVDIEAINRSDVKVSLSKVVFKPFGVGMTLESALAKNDKQSNKFKITIPSYAKNSHPYWLVNDHDLGVFNVNDQLKIGKGENSPAVTAEFLLEINGESITYKKPVIFKRNDPVMGEVYRPFVIAPPVYANVSGDVMIFANHASQNIKVDVIAGRSDVTGKLRLKLPSSWKVEPDFYNFSLDQKGKSTSYHFLVSPPDKQEITTAHAIIEMDGKSYDKSLTEINYDHIPAQLLFKKSAVKCVKIEMDKGMEKIGYIMGAGDNIPANLRQIGYEVNIINDQSFDEENLDQYDVIILGIRALNTVEKLKFEMKKLLDFVYRGGNLIIQYNTNHRLVTQEFAPYPLELSRARVAVEEADIEILDPSHPILNYPNKITREDFKGWVQERGLYFPGKWADEYDAVISSHDPGEEPLDGGILTAKYGKGVFIYSGYSWFRELPAGVPGAYRMFVNMISLDQAQYN